MSRGPRALIVTSLILHLTTGLVHADLRSDVHNEIRRSQITQGRIAISIRDASSTDDSLVSVFWENGSFSSAADTPMIPASNMKLLTTGAALHELGADFVFETKLVRDGRRLIVIGDGDPAFGDPELLETMTVGEQNGLSVEDFLNLWIRPVVDSDLDEITELIVDDRIFQHEYVHPTWPVNQLNRRYCAEVSGLNFHLNVLHFFPRPDANGGFPDLQLMEPKARWISPRNRATSKRGVNDRSDVWIARQPDSNDMTFYGNVKFPYQTPVPVTVHDMPSFFARLMAERLTSAGIIVNDYRIASDNDPDPTGELIGPVIKTPLTVAIMRCNRDSQNLYAESLLKRISFEMTRQPASWPIGQGILRGIVKERLGMSIAPPDLIVADGSGLSRENRISADTFTLWLNTFHRDEVNGPILKDTLALAGVSGTLENRFRTVDLYGAKVQAKSGYINEVSCLTGFVTMPDGRCHTFSIMGNGLTGPGAVRLAKAMQEKIVSAIARNMAAVELSLGSD